MDLGDVIKIHESRLKATGVLPLSRNRAQILARLTQNSSEWESARRLLWGASELPMALGCSPYATANQFLRRKWSSQGPTAAMIRGKEQETTLAKLYVHKYKVRSSAWHFILLRHRHHRRPSLNLISGAATVSSIPKY